MKTTLTGSETAQVTGTSGMVRGASGDSTLTSGVRVTVRRGFTLVEMLAVIAIIAILAGLVLGLTSRASRAGRDNKIKAMRDQLITAIEAYHAEFGYYPPDNRKSYPPVINSVSNGLFYELTGVVVDNRLGQFHVPDRGEVIAAGWVTTYFGVEGFVNATPDPKKVKKFIELKSDQVEQLSVDPAHPALHVLAAPVSWPLRIHPDQHPVRGRPGLNPWRYVSTNPTNNPGRYDLWAEFVDGKQVRMICNWQKDVIDRP
jgi:prepilin-type N-terminal cleavage/methylation domain-containing protein